MVLVKSLVDTPWSPWNPAALLGATGARGLATRLRDGWAPHRKVRRMGPDNPKPLNEATHLQLNKQLY